MILSPPKAQAMVKT